MTVAFVLAGLKILLYLIAGRNYGYFAMNCITCPTVEENQPRRTSVRGIV